MILELIVGWMALMVIVNIVILAVKQLRSKL